MIKFWNNETLTLPSGLVCNEEKIKELYPFTRFGRTIIDTIDGITYGIDSLGLLKQCYNISEGLTDEKIIEAIIAARTPQPAAE
jgi:hypothetical protein